MKKALSLILALVMCLSLCACGGGEGSIPTDNDTTQNTNSEQNGTTGEVENNTTESNNDNTETSLVIRDTDGTAYINVDRCSEIVEEVVELTTDNWMNYFKICYFDKPSGFEDAGYELVANTDRYHGFVDVVIEFKNKTTGEVVTRELEYNGCTVGENFVLDDYDCTKIQGYLYFVDFPEEAIINSEYYGTAYKLAWGTDKNISSTSVYFSIDTRTKAVVITSEMMK